METKHSIWKGWGDEYIRVINDEYFMIDTGNVITLRKIHNNNEIVLVVYYNDYRRFKKRSTHIIPEKIKNLFILYCYNRGIKS